MLTLENTLSMLKDMRSDINDNSSTLLINRTALFFDTIRDSYEEYIENTYRENKHFRYKDIDKEIVKLQDYCRKNTNFGSMLIPAYELNEASQILVKTIDEFIKNSMKFMQKDYTNIEKCEDDSDDIIDAIEDNKVKFDVCFSMKTNKFVSKTLSELYFANSTSLEIAKIGKERALDKNIRKCKELLLEYIDDCLDHPKNIDSSIILSKRTTFQKSMNIIKGMIGTYYGSIVRTVAAIHMKKPEDLTEDM